MRRDSTDWSCPRVNRGEFPRRWEGAWEWGRAPSEVGLAAGSQPEAQSLARAADDGERRHCVADRRAEGLANSRAQGNSLTAAGRLGCTASSCPRTSMAFAIRSFIR